MAYNIKIGFLGWIALQMSTAYSPGFDLRTAIWCLQCAEKRAAHHCLILQAPENRCFITTANYRQRGMWKTYPASRGTRRARTFICAHWDASEDRHKALPWSGSARASTWRCQNFLPFLFVHPSVEGTGEKNDTATFAAIVGQWQKQFGPLNAAVRGFSEST